MTTTDQADTPTDTNTNTSVNSATDQTMLTVDGDRRGVSHHEIPSGRVITIPAVDHDPDVPDDVLGKSMDKIHPDMLDDVRELYIERGEPTPPTGVVMMDELGWPKERFNAYGVDSVHRYAGIPTVRDVLEAWAADHVRYCYGTSTYFRPTRPAEDIGITGRMLSPALEALENQFDDRDPTPPVRLVCDRKAQSGGYRWYAELTDPDADPTPDREGFR